MSLSYMLSASAKSGQAQDPIVWASTIRFMLRYHLAQLQVQQASPLTLHTALPIVHNLLAIGTGYLASLPDGERFGLDDQLLELFGTSARVEAGVDDCAVTDFVRVLNNALEKTAEHVGLPELANALPTIRAVLAQAAALYFAQDPLLNPSLALFVCYDIDAQITGGSPLQAVVMVGFLRDQILTAGWALEAESVDLDRDPGARYRKPDDDEQPGAAGAEVVPLDVVIRYRSELTAEELTRPFVPVDRDAALLKALVTQHAALTCRPETPMLDLLRMISAVRMKRREVDWAHGLNATVRRENLRVVD